MNTMKKVWVLAFLLLTLSGEALAQNGELTQVPTGDFSGLPLDQLPPGARALGLGGAFTAVADDATAALANPAGLTNLSASEISLSGRNTDADVIFLDPDAYSSAVNYEAGELNKTYSDSSTDVSFASFVLPFEEVTISGFYSSQVNFDAAQSQADDIFDEVIRSDDFAYLDGYSNFNAIKSKLYNYGLSAAFRISDQWSAGLTIKNSKLKLRSEDNFQMNYWNDFEWELANAFSSNGVGTISEAEAYLGVVNDNYTYQTIVDDSETSMSFDLGLLYKAEKWSVGAVYHRGPDFELATVGTAAGGFGCVGDAGNELVQNCQELDAFLQSEWEGNGNTGSWQQLYPNAVVNTETEISIPDVFSLGFAWRPTDTFLISLDINRINYSVLNGPRQFTQGFDLDLNDVERRSNFYYDDQNQAQDIPFYDTDIASSTLPFIDEIKDKTTVHVGLEKFFVYQSGPLRTLALRGGAFSVQDHDGNALTDNDDTVWTVGVGTTWGTYGGDKAFQLDLAASFADEVTNIILSGIFRF